MAATVILDQQRNIPPPSYSPRTADGPPPRRRRSRLGLWFALAALAVGGCGVVWYSYSRLNGHDSLLSALKRVPLQLDELRHRLSDAEKRLGGVPEEIAALRSQLAATRVTVGHQVEQARKNVRDVTLSVRKELLEALEARDRTADTRFRRLEEEQQTEAVRAAGLERELGQLRQQLAAVTQDVTHVQNAAALDSQRLRQEVRSTDRRLTQVVSFNNRPRERFEARKGRTYEISPGIYLHVSHTDPGHRRFNGWLQLTEPAKILWLRDESILQPVAFHAGKQTLQHDLVITGLTRDAVSGYLILPSLAESRRDELLVSASGAGPMD